MRHLNWQDRYAEALRAAYRTPFAWGEHDCVLFAAKVVDAISDLDTEARMRAKYTWTDALSATRIMRDAGGLKALTAEILGDSIPASWCTTGDVVLSSKDGYEVVAVCDGAYLLAADDVGYIRLPLSFGVAGWKV